MKEEELTVWALSYRAEDEEDGTDEWGVDGVFLSKADAQKSLRSTLRDIVSQIRDGFDPESDEDYDPDMTDDEFASRYCETFETDDMSFDVSYSGYRRRYRIEEKSLS